MGNHRERWGEACSANPSRNAEEDVAVPKSARSLELLSPSSTNFSREKSLIRHRVQASGIIGGPGGHFKGPPTLTNKERFSGVSHFIALCRYSVFINIKATPQMMVSSFSNKIFFD